MEVNEKSINAWIAYWKDYIGNYDLPTWDSIPNFGLYMEQVITFLRDSLHYIDDGISAEPIITAAAINNYVRKKYMPQPIKKRYYRHHIAYLIILCALKQSLSISEIQTILPMDTPEEELHTFYNAFTQRHKRAAGYFINRVENVKNTIANDENLERLFKNNASEIIIDVALIASFAKLLSERLISSGGSLPFPTDDSLPDKD